MTKPKIVKLENNEDGALEALKRALALATGGEVQGVVVCILLDENRQTWECGGLSTYEAVGLIQAVSQDILDQTTE